MLPRAAEHMFALTLFAAINCHVSDVPGHLPLLDLFCAFGLSWATAQLARAHGNTTVRACLTVMVLRWGTSLVSLTLSPTVNPPLKKFVLFVQLAAFCTLAIL